MGWAAAAASLVVLPGFTSAESINGVNGRLIGVGSLSNPNEIAFHLWLGMPFLLLLAYRSSRLKRYLLLSVCCIELVLIVKTLSREGLLLALLAFIVALVRASAMNKVKLVVAAFGVCIFAALTLSHQALDRYLTLFTSNVGGVAARSAEASSHMRQQKLMESIELTIRHPLFGVGMGVFMPASVDVAKERGVKGDWEVSHNSYTQVSSELGLPGIFILLAIYFTAWRQLRQVDRAAKRHERQDVRQVVFTLRIALIVLCIHFCFDSMAYLFYMPLVVGLIASFGLAYQSLLFESAEPSRAGTTAVPHQAVSQLTFPRAPVALSRSTGTTKAPLPPRNPYRFGRRR